VPKGEPVAVDHPLLRAVAPLVERVHGELVSPDEMTPDDVPLEWDGETVAAVRLAAAAGPVGDLAQLLENLSGELGGPLSSLSRVDKQRAVRLLESRGAFTYRKSAEIVAEALGVTRFTVYNYLNRERADLQQTVDVAQE
jgi:CRP-like cAMP-binding protein